MALAALLPLRSLGLAGVRVFPRAVALAIVLGCGPLAASEPWAGVSRGGVAGGDGLEPHRAAMVFAPTAEEVEAYRSLQARRAGYESELQRLRRAYFVGVRNPARRALGIRLLRAYTDPAAFELMADVFFGEGEDVRDGLLEHFASLGTGEGDATLAWESVYSERADDRRAARDVLMRVASERGVSRLVDDVVRNGLSEAEDGLVVSAARTAAALRLFELIPQIAAAQVSARGNDGPQGDLGWIFIGQQRTFIFDVTPIVSDNAVAFDPQLGVVSEGVILRISGAFVAEYRVALNGVLMGMATDAWGPGAPNFGYDPGAWGRWYSDELVPVLEARALAGSEAAESVDGDGESTGVGQP